MDEFWVFGYGSLMWNPGFPYQESIAARVGGYHRSLCVRSYVHRGTEERPGLVLGLDRGGSCRGVAFRVAAADRDHTIAYLRARELVTSVYLERSVRAHLADGRAVSALTYVIDRGHHQYAGSVTVEEAVQVVRGAVGRSGANPVYVANTLTHLRALGIRDNWLESLVSAMADAGPLPEDESR